MQKAEIKEFGYSSLVNSACYDLFLRSIRNEITRKSYRRQFQKFLDFSKKDPDTLVNDIPTKELTQLLKNFFIDISDSLAPTSVHTVYCAVKYFFDINDVVLNWRQILRSTPKNQSIVDDRLYTMDEIRKLLDHADLREQTILFTLLTTGMRIGGLAELKMSDLQYLDNSKLYKIIVYSAFKHYRYTTFCTPECTIIINKYIKYRQENGETITENSPLITRGIDPAKMTQKLQQASIEMVMARLRQKSKIFEKPENANARTRYPVMKCHGFRKIFNTKCIEANLNGTVKEILMGHKQKLGLDIHYYRPSEQQLLTEYLKAVDILTINEEFRLSKQVKELNEKNEYQNYVIDKKLKSLEDFVLQMFENYEKVDNIESQKLSKKIKEANDRGECYAIYPDVKPTEKEILEKDMKDDVYKRWALMLLNRPDLQKKYNVQMSFKDK